MNLLLLLFRLRRVLIILFAFEFLVIKIFFALVFFRTPLDRSFVLIFLAVVACEASIGLTLMVSLLRQGGNDNVKVSTPLLRDGVNSVRNSN
jgi:NADH:ubiquinone oxidoreductase subunit K